MLGQLAPVAMDAFSDLILGSRCAGCGRPGRRWCPQCARTLSGPAHRSVPDPAPEGLPAVWAVGVNDGPVAAAVIAHKERGETALARPLGAALGRAVLAALDRNTAGAARAPVRVVPVPSAPGAVRRRGYDPLLRITRAAIRTRRVRVAGVRPELRPALRVTREVADQASLGSGARRANLHGAFAVGDRFRARMRDVPVLLVDDLITTGATLVEATRALTAVGARVQGAAVVAATVRDSGRKAQVDTQLRVPSRTGSG